MVEFDKYGRIKNRNYRPEPISGLRHTSTRSYRRGSWAKFDDFISDIGYWFEDNGESISLYVTYALLALLVVVYLIYVIGIWIEDGFFMAIIAAIIGGVIGYYAGILSIGIISFCIRIICRVLQLIFKNAICFLVFIFLTLLWSLHVYL